MSSFNKLKETLGPMKVIVIGRIYNLKRKFFGDNFSLIKIDTKQGVFFVDPNDFGVGRELIKKRSYGKDEIKEILKRVGKKDELLFVGAHIGAIAIPISKYVSKGIAIEANPETFKILKENISLNNSQNIIPLQIAASDKKEKIKFVLSKTNSGGSKRMPLKKSWIYFYDKPKIIEVEADKLDNVFEGKKFDLIFMDIEGSEFFALRGMPNLLKKTNYLFVEFTPHHLKNVSGVSPEQFIETIQPFFSKLYIPSQKLSLDKKNFLPALLRMYQANQSENIIIFSK